MRKVGNSALNRSITYLWDRIPLIVRCTRYNIMWWRFSVFYDRSVVFSGYSGFLHQ